jgi:PGF-CTERM protein
MGATDVTRVGADPANRIDVDGDRLWPSDHAGVVATLSPDAAPTATPSSTPIRTATATPARTGTPTRTPTEAMSVSVDDDTTVTVPGFGVAAGVASVVAAALAARRRAEDD